MAADKIVKCEIFTNNKPAFTGKCIFSSDKGGSFSLSGVKGTPFFDGISDVSVNIIENGVADVRGLTSDGMNSRWGEAKRSTKDKSCWIGDDFKICAR
jgi:hypothetical protein